VALLSQEKCLPLQDPARANERRRVPILVEARDLHDVAGVRRVDELTTADVHASPMGATPSTGAVHAEHRGLGRPQHRLTRQSTSEMERGTPRPRIRVKLRRRMIRGLSKAHLAVHQRRSFSTACSSAMYWCGPNRLGVLVSTRVSTRGRPCTSSAFQRSQQETAKEAR
jgi:hypothetical protein